MQDPLNAFVLGDYLSAARHLTPDTWQYWASLGLIGHPADAAAALQPCSDPDAQFYRGVAAWMRGDDDVALGVLEGCQGDHARRLAQLIRNRPITVLAQLPWNRRGSWDVLTHLTDPAFRLLNVSFHRNDIPNQPYADARTFLPRGVQPDFFVAEMLEWHLIAPNVRELGCPVIGHTSDFDIHIQAIAPWLDLFDELVVLDHVEWRDLSRLARAPVSVFPKVFGVPAALPPLVDGDRDVDLFLSGTVAHPYHIDKDPIILAALSVPGIRLRMVNGFDAEQDYYRNLTRTKLCCSYVRHPGGLPTRGLEALGLGCVVAVQEENALRLFADERAGVVGYGPAAGKLTDVIQEVLARWDEFSVRARAGADIVRREFALERVASQYFRFLTFLAARPRVAREAPQHDSLVQKRAVVQKGWLPSYKFGDSLLIEWAAASAARIQKQLQVEETPRLLNDLARERLLAHYHDLIGGESRWFDSVVTPLERAIALSPEVLVPRFNLVRVLLHFGSPAQVRRGLTLIDDTLRHPVGAWRVDPLDDVLPWDFCSSLFNYRRYFDAIVAALTTPAGTVSGQPELVATILASLNFYRAKYASEVAGEVGATDWAAQAVHLDPDFAEYELHLCRLLLARGRPAGAREACSRLENLSARSARVMEIQDLARQLPQQMQGDWYDDLERRAERLWSAMQVRKDLPEPLLRSAMQDIRTK